MDANEGMSLVGLFGHPVKHSKSPQMHNAAFAERGLPFRYMAFDILPEYLADAVAAVRALGMRGVNVTIPHKVHVMDYLDRITPEAELIGAVNTIVNENGILVGHNTDGDGYVRSLLEETGLPLKETRALILGAGGAARAVASALALAGIKEMYIMNRTPEKSDALAARLADFCPAHSITEDQMAGVIRDVGLIVNTTSIGMHPASGQSPLDPGLLHAELVVSDLIYNPRETLLLKQARSIGASVHGGLGMFINQGAQAFTLWTGSETPVNTMRRVVEDLL